MANADEEVRGFGLVIRTTKVFDPARGFAPLPNEVRMAGWTGLEPATSDVTGTKDAAAAKGVGETVSELRRQGPTRTDTNGLLYAALRARSFLGGNTGGQRVKAGFCVARDAWQLSGRTIVALVLLSSSACGIPPRDRPTTKPMSSSQDQLALDDLPRLPQPRLTVDATGLVQVGRHLEAAALVTNADPELDGRKATVTLVARNSDGQVVVQRTIELIGIPANRTIATSEAIELDSEARVTQVQAFAGLADAAVHRAQRAQPLEPSNVMVRVDPAGALSVTGRLAQRLTYPGRYRVDAVLVDRDGAIVASARSTRFVALGPDAKSEWATFTATGQAKPGIDASRLRPIVTIMPVGGKS